MSKETKITNANQVVNAKITGIRVTREYDRPYYVLRFDKNVIVDGTLVDDAAPAARNVLKLSKGRLMAIMCKHVAYVDRMINDYIDRHELFGHEQISAILTDATVGIQSSYVAAGEERIFDGETYRYKYDQYVTEFATLETTDDVAETLFAFYGKTKSLADILKARKS